MIFDNVGGATLDALLPHAAVDARVVLCGATPEATEPPLRVPVGSPAKRILQARMELRRTSRS